MLGLVIGSILFVSFQNGIFDFFFTGYRLFYIGFWIPCLR
jgi:hypothetical protein